MFLSCMAWLTMPLVQSCSLRAQLCFRQPCELMSHPRQASLMPQASGIYLLLTKPQPCRHRSQRSCHQPLRIRNYHRTQWFSGIEQRGVGSK